MLIQKIFVIIFMAKLSSHKIHKICSDVIKNIYMPIKYTILIAKNNPNSRVHSFGIIFPHE